MTAPAHERPGRQVTLRVRALADPVLGIGLVLVGILWFLGVKTGGYDPRHWYPAGLLVLGLVLIVVHGRLQRRGLPLRVRAAIAALAAYAAWTAATVAWASAKGVAWDGANMTVLYLALFLVTVSIPWRASVAAATLGALGAAVAATGTFELVRASGSADPSAAFSFGRLSSPFDYQNAACAWFLLAAWPLVRLASQRGAPVAVRAVAGAALGTLPALALLCQSRASLVAAAVAAAAYLLVVPGRARSLVYLALAVAPTAVWHAQLLDVYSALKAGAGVGDAVSTARNVVFAAAGVVGVGSLLLAVADARLPASRLRGAARITVLAVALAALLGGAVATAVLLDHPVARARSAWSDFRQVKPASSSSYFANGLGGNRYDIWRVAVDTFERHPVAGIGADNFLAEYLQHRSSSLETPRYPHSLELRVLSETGIVGAILFAVFLGCVVVAVSRLRRLPHELRAWSGVALVTAFYWLVHGSVDWFWEIPALGGIAFVSTGIAVALQVGEPGPAPSPPARSPAARLLAGGAVTAACLLAAVSFALPWVAAEEVALAGRSWRVEPAAAYDRLRLASRLNPLSSRPYLVEGAIAARRGERGRMIRGFTAAIRRDRREWFAEIELAVAYLSAGRTAAASEHLARARRLNPRDASIAVVGAALRDHRPLPLTALDRLFLKGT